MLMTTDHKDYLPASVASLDNPQTDIPRIAKDQRLLAEIAAAIQQRVAPKITSVHSRQSGLRRMTA